MPASRYAPLFLLASLFWGSCTKDLSCYRDMIIGIWVEQTFDGKVPATNLRSVYSFEPRGVIKIIGLFDQENGSRVVDSLQLSYEVYCKTLTLTHIYWLKEYKIVRFSDTTLRVQNTLYITADGITDPEIQEITFKKVNRKKLNTNPIYGLWEIDGYRIRFESLNVYRFYENINGVWVEKSDETGRYYLYDSFLMISFFNNPLFGTPYKQDAACWELSFNKEEIKGEGEVTTILKMIWSASIAKNGEYSNKNLTFTAIEAL